MKFTFVLLPFVLTSSVLEKCYKTQETNLWLKFFPKSSYVRKRKYGPQDHDAISWNRLYAMHAESYEPKISFENEKELIRGDTDEEPLKRTKRVLGGQNAKPGMFPHQVSLQVSSQ